MLIGHSYVFFREMCIHICFPFLVVLFVFLSLSCKSSLYILDIRPLSGYMIYKTFLPPPHSVVCLYIFLRGSLKAQKFFYFDEANLPMLFLIACAFAVIGKKPLPNPRPQGFIFYSKIFTVSGLKFKSLIHFV